MTICNGQRVLYRAFFVPALCAAFALIMSAPLFAQDDSSAECAKKSQSGTVNGWKQAGERCRNPGAECGHLKICVEGSHYNFQTKTQTWWCECRGAGDGDVIDGADLSVIRFDGELSELYYTNRPECNADAEFAFELDSEQQASLVVYNAMGQAVTTLLEGRYNAGAYDVQWHRANLEAGVYYYQLRTERGTQTRTLVLN